MNEEKKIDINEPKNYTFKALDLCIIKNCTNPVEWYIMEGIGRCMDCFKELEESTQSTDSKNKEVENV